MDYFASYIQSFSLSALRGRERERCQLLVDCRPQAKLWKCRRNNRNNSNNEHSPINAKL